MQYLVTLQQPRSVWYEQQVTVQADNVNEAQRLAIVYADAIGWANARQLADDAGRPLVFRVQAVHPDGSLSGDLLPAPVIPDLLAALRSALGQVEDSLEPDQRPLPPGRIN